MPVASTDLVIVERGGVPYQSTAGAIGALGAAAMHGLEPGLVVGSYISSALNATALGVTPAASAGRIDFMPFRPGIARLIDELALEVTTQIAASQARVGIYSSTGAEAPNALLTGQGALLDCASTGAKPSAITPISLAPGVLYWLAAHSSLTQAYRGIAVSALQSLGHAATGTAVYTLRRATATFALGLPTVAPATTLTSAIAPWVRMRID